MRKHNESLVIELLNYIKKYQISNGRSPSYRNIMQNMKFSSLSMVYRYVNILKSKDYLNKNKYESITLPSKIKTNKTTLAPLVGTVTCGEPIYAYENIEGYYYLPADIFGTGETFLLHAKGQSMIDAGIKDNDILVVRKCQNAYDGDIVVALIDEEATVKRFFKKRNKIVLHPENKEFKDIIVDNVQILGKVISCIHNF